MRIIPTTKESQAMHMPNGPGEWAFMSVLMIVFMAVFMVGVHAVWSHLRGPRD